MTKKLGVIVNPIAGLGGRVGLKGTDGTDVVERARQLGAQPEAPARATETLRHIAARLGVDVRVIAAPGEMGATEATEVGFDPEVAGVAATGATSADDTMKAASEMVGRGVDLLLFAGGDGTARDIHGAVGDKVPVLGIPAGVKMHSAVYATSPRAAAEVAIGFLTGRVTEVREAEVMDIDEEAFRAGTLSAKLYGYLRVPYEARLVQSAKDGRGNSDEAALEGIAADFAERVETGVVYVMGPGTTVRALSEKLGVEKTLLGVDLVQNGRLLASDVTESEILEVVSEQPAKIVVTPIGGQGHIFGRGNQQISAEVIRRVGRDNVMVVATPEKLAGLRGSALLVDTGDAELDAMLGGYVKVMTGYKTETVIKVEA